MNNTPRIIFFGTPTFSLPALEAIMQNGYIPVAIITAPDRPAGRGLHMTPSPISQYAHEHDYQGVVLTPESIDEISLSRIAALKPTLGISVAYGIILPQKLLDLFPQGILNIHPSLLPKHRGPSPLQYQILNGDESCGVTIMKIDAKMDHGSILAQETFRVDPLIITYLELHDMSAQKGAALLLDTLNNLEARLVGARTQDDSKATVTRLLTKDRGLIDWSKDACEIDRMVRALNPWPGTFTFLGNKRIRLIQIRPLDTEPSLKDPGYVYEKNGVLCVVCGKGVIQIESIQVEGEKPTSGSDFVRAHSSLLNTVLQNTPSSSL